MLMGIWLANVYITDLLYVLKFQNDLKLYSFFSFDIAKRVQDVKHGFNLLE